MKKIVFLLMVCLSYLHTFSAEEISINYKKANVLYGPNSSTTNSLIVQDNKYGVTGLTNFMDNYKGLVRLKIDHSNTTAYTKYTATVTFEVTCVTINSGGQTTASPQTIQLTVTHNPQDADISQIDLQQYMFVDAAKMEIKITGILFEQGSSFTSSNIPNNLLLEAEVQTKRYYTFPTNIQWNLNYTEIDNNISNSYLLNSSYNNVKDELEIHWNYITGAEEYELEWTYVNDYSNNFNGTTNIPISKSDLLYNFRNNSTKVRIANNFYRIPLVFDRGYLIYRLRCVGNDGYGNDTFSEWTLDDPFSSGSIAQIENTMYLRSNTHFYRTFPFENEINWQYITTFAEEGKNKSVVNFMDPTFRSRQQVTKINTSEDVIVGETVYDYQGRAAINILPSPTGEKALQYYWNFNLANTTGTKYSWSDFDKDASSCYSEADKLKNTTGASNYYSPQNPDQFLQQGAVPDANGYPFIQTEYMPDNTGKIKNQGGAGEDFQIKNNKHYTSYLYGQPFQQELDRLFGSEAGNYEHYQKNAVIDPNGQVSVSYIDMYGKVIATALAGTSPTNLDALESNTSQNPLSIQEEMLSSSSTCTLDGNGIVFSKDFLITDNNSEVDFLYSFNTQFYNECMYQSSCYTCNYILKTELIENKCNTILLKDSSNIGTINFSSCSSTTINKTIQKLNLAPGSYTIRKSLMLDEQAINTYADKFMAVDNYCYSPVEPVMPDTSNCCWTCEKCKNAVEASGYLDKLRSLYPDWTSNQVSAYYQRQLNLCKEICEAPNICEIAFSSLLMDVSPGGQYAEYKDKNELINTSLYNLSLLNVNNVLGTSLDINSNSVHKDWKHPFSPYLDKDGNPVLINIDDDLTKADNTPNGLITQDGHYYVAPEHLKSVELFVNNWQSSFANSLVQYHPEYYYSEWCNQNNVQNGTYGNDPISSNEFDRILENCDNTQTEFNNFQSKGFFNNLNSIMNADPFFQTGNIGAGNIGCRDKLYHYVDNTNFINSTITGITLMTELMKNYKYNPDNSSSTVYDIAQVALLSNKCMENDYTTSPVLSCNVPSPPYGTSTLTSLGLIDANDFKTYLGLYLLCKKKVQEIYADCYSLTNHPQNFYNEIISFNPHGKPKGVFTPFYPRGDHRTIWQSIWNILGISNTILPYQTDDDPVYYNRKKDEFIQYGITSQSSPWPILPFVNRLYAYYNSYYFSVPAAQYMNLYTNKQKRFPKINDSYDITGKKFGSDSDNDDEMAAKLKEAADFNFYKTTGQCPLARDLEKVLDFVAKNYNLGATMYVSANNYSQLFYQSLTGPSNMKKCVWEGTSNGTSLTGDIYFDVTINGNGSITNGTKVATISLTGLPSSITSWASIKGISQLKANSSNNFTIHIKYENSSGNNVEAILNGSITYQLYNFQLTGCQFEDECVTNGETETLSQLLTLMLAGARYPVNNPTFGASYTTLTGTSSPLQQTPPSYELVFNNLIMFSELKNYFYNPSDPNNSVNYQVAVDISNKTFKIKKGTAEMIIELTGSNLPSTNDGWFDNVAHNSGVSDNQFTLKFIDLNSQPNVNIDYTATVTYFVTYNIVDANNSSSSVAKQLDFEAGKCQPIVLAECKSQFHDNLRDMQSFIAKVTKNHLLNQNFNLFPGNYISDNLLSQLGGFYDLKWESSTSNDGTTLFVNIISNNNTDTCHFIFTNNTPNTTTDFYSISTSSSSSLPMTLKLHPDHNESNYSNYFQITNLFLNSNYLILNGSSQCIMMSECVQPCAPGTYVPTTYAYKCDFDNNVGYTSDYTYNGTLNTPACTYLNNGYCTGCTELLNGQSYFLAKSIFVPCAYNLNHILNDPGNSGMGHYMALFNDQAVPDNNKKIIWEKYDITVEKGSYYQFSFDFYNCARQQSGSTYYIYINGTLQEFNELDNISDHPLENLGIIGNNYYEHWRTIKFPLWFSNNDTIADIKIEFSTQSISSTNGYYIVTAMDNVILQKMAPCNCLPDTFPTSPPISPKDTCIANLMNIAANNAYIINQYKLDSLRKDFISKYKIKCLSNLSESLQAIIYSPEYHYTLYYYDQSGNLLQTIPPQGVSPINDPNTLNAIKTYRNSGSGNPLYPSHRMATTYTYNSLNQLIKQKTPDAGESEFWYDELGRIIISQNAKQQGGTKYSYTIYDALGRIIEVGEINKNNILNNTYVTNAVNHFISCTNFVTWLTTGTKSQITKTYYDEPMNGFNNPYSSSVFSQDNLMKRVAASAYFENDGSTYQFATHYSYDIHGNVKSLLQDFPIMGNNQYKLINYEYDLVSGKVNKVIYQPGALDQFMHRYEYDADNRLTHVFTSRDDMIWEKEAKYWYYKHGPLARTEIGDLELQGMDYAYTLQGWVKGINSTLLDNTKDLGGDNNNTTGNLHSKFAKDAASYSLNYFSGDYTPINNNFSNFASTINNTIMPHGLYNGNIRAMATTIHSGTNSTVVPQLTVYNYDQLNRIKQMQTYKDMTGNAWNTSQNYPDAYKETYTYDANGNITQLTRKDNLGTAFDNLIYNYNGTTILSNTDVTSWTIANNKLTGVNQNASSVTDQFATTSYTYDLIGNLTADNAEHITNTDWNVYGKIKQITKSGSDANIEFMYDAQGNRVYKKVIPKTGNPTYTFYTRDAQGNILATYTKSNMALPSTDPNDPPPVAWHTFLSEYDLYGSSRIGVKMPNLLIDNTTPTSTLTFSRVLGLKRYEIDNHLGNVLTTFTDRKYEIQSGSTITEYQTYINSSQDYYPFGMQMPNRGINCVSGNYRFGFNGQEKTDEISGEGNHLDFKHRGYDPRIGRFFSVDPLIKKYPELTSYQFAGNRPVDCIDLDGLEPIPTSFLKMNPDINKIWTEGEANTYSGIIDGITYASTTGTYYLGLTKCAYGFDYKDLFYKDKPYNFSDGWQNQLRFWGGVATVTTSVSAVFKLARSANIISKTSTINEMFSTAISNRHVAENYALLTKFKGYFNMNKEIVNNPVYDLINFAKSTIVDVTTTTMKNLRANSWLYRKIDRLATMKPQGIKNSILQIYVKEGQYTEKELKNFTKQLTDYVENNYKNDNIKISVEKVKK